MSIWEQIRAWPIRLYRNFLWPFFFFLWYGTAEIEQSSFFLSPEAEAGHLMLPGGVAVVLLFF